MEKCHWISIKALINGLKTYREPSHRLIFSQYILHIHQLHTVVQTNITSNKVTGHWIPQGTCVMCNSNVIIIVQL